MLRSMYLTFVIVIISGCASSPKLLPSHAEQKDVMAEYTNRKQSLFPIEMQAEIDQFIVRSFTDHFNSHFFDRESPTKEISEVGRDKNGRVMMFSETWTYRIKEFDSKKPRNFVFRVYGYPSAENHDKDISRNFPFYVGRLTYGCFVFRKQRYLITTIPRLTQPPANFSDFYRQPLRRAGCD